MINNKHDFLIYIIITFVLFICLKFYYESDSYNLRCIISDVDGNTYCVRERAKLQMAADLLAKVTNKCVNLVNYVDKHHPDNKDVQRLVIKFNPSNITETLPTSEHTAYSENKGEKIAFCLNSTKDGNKLIDLNTLTFVAIHELSHIMTVDEGHKQAFWINFKFLLDNAKKANIYNPINYKKNPKNYCGMLITDNPFYDL